MNNDKWLKYLEYCTSDIHNSHTTGIGSENHLGLTFDFFQRHISDSPEQTFLDIGCGNAVKAKTTNRIKAKWTGFDLNKCEGVIQGDMHELPFNDESFDTVFSSHALEHTVSPLICLTEMFRVLKQTGNLILGVPIAPGFMATAHNYVLTKKGWALLLERSGFILKIYEEKHNCGMFHCVKRRR